MRREPRGRSGLACSAVPLSAIFCSGKSKPSGAVPACRTLTSAAARLLVLVVSTTSSGSEPRLSGEGTSSPKWKLICRDAEK